ncbi:MAG: hypothetical protein K2J08_06005 [Ruminococcus sp.]|nr:hypothetical protein [Ruminococcus sp.]
MKELTARNVRKTMRKNRKENAGKYMPYTVSLQKWCISYGVPKHFDWLRSLVLTELDKDEDIGDYIFIGEDLYDLHLDNDGVFILSHILNDFFGVEQVREMWKYLRAINEEKKLFFDFAEMLKDFTSSQLDEYEKKFIETAVEAETQQTKSEFLEIIKAERKRRSRSFRKKAGEKYKRQQIL